MKAKAKSGKKKAVIRQKMKELITKRSVLQTQNSEGGLFRPKENDPRWKNRGTEVQEGIKSIRKGK